MPSPETSPSSTLDSLFCAALSKPFSDACKTGWQSLALDEPAPVLPELSQAAAFHFVFSGEVAGEGCILLGHNDVMALNLKNISDDSGLFGEQHVSALTKVIEASCNNVGRQLSRKALVEVQVERFASSELPSGHMTQIILETDDQTARVSVFICFDTSLVASLKNASPETLSYPEVNGTAPSNLDLVLDVELNVTLRFGQRQMSLREVLDLASGSVVELDRQVDEPVELVLDGKIVARGEAVIIDGNYGMRITQVLQQVLA